jgi:mutual gliding-motility protein MglA
MSFINYDTKEVHFKIVYYGPGLAGKTTNMQFIHERVPADTKGKWTNLATAPERTIFFDFRTGSVRGYDCRLHLFTIPGPVFYDLSSVTMLKGVDGIIFVADSQEGRANANVESLEQLETDLAANGNNLVGIPMVLQYNKRDLPGVASVAELDAMLNPAGRMRFEASAVTGVGVFETLKAIAKQVLAKASAG